MMPRLIRIPSVVAASAAALLGLSCVAFESLDRAFPPPLPEKLAVSTEVTDRDGAAAACLCDA